MARTLLLLTILCVPSVLWAQESHMVNSSAVNLRTEPSMSADVQFRLPFGTRCDRLETKKGWVKIRVKSKETYLGWVRKSFVSDVFYAPTARGQRWIDLAQAPEKGIKRPVVFEDYPCNSLDVKCIEDYRNSYYIERRNALERWVFWDAEVSIESRSELWAILGGPHTPYGETPADILNASPFSRLPKAVYTGARESYKTDIHGFRARGLECTPIPNVKRSFFQELPERFAVARGMAHGGIIDFSGADGRDELTKVLRVYFTDDSPFEFETSDRYVSRTAIPFVIYDVETGALQRNLGQPTYIPSRNMFLLTNLETERPEKRPVVIFYSWIEVYLDQVMQAKAVEKLTLKDRKVRGKDCLKASFHWDAYDFDADKIADVVLMEGEKPGSCGYRRKDTYVNVDGTWQGFVNSYEAWCDDMKVEPTATPTPLPF